MSIGRYSTPHMYEVFNRRVFKVFFQNRPRNSGAIREFFKKSLLLFKKKPKYLKIINIDEKVKILHI